MEKVGLTDAYTNEESTQVVVSGVTDRLGAFGHINTLGPNLTHDRIPELLINLSKSSMVLKQRFPC